MPEHAEPATPLPAVRRSRKLTAAVVILAILPLLLPFPFYLLNVVWIGPIINEKMLECVSFDCSAALDLERLEVLLILGPSILAAVASLLLGYIGRFQARRRPTSPENAALFMVSITCGYAWAVLLGCGLWVGMSLVYL